MKSKIDFNYTGSFQSVSLKAGKYFIECWGASGGSKSGHVGKGSYVSGELTLKVATTLFIYVGGQGVTRSQQKTFNGGGAARYAYNNNWYWSSGGGATDVRLVGGLWNSFESLKSRIIVAGGGGGTVNYVSSNASNVQSGGNGGSYEGELGLFSQCNDCIGPTPYIYATGGSQQSGGKGGGCDGYFGNNGSFGEGGDSSNILSSSGGGGGYFGGGGGGISNHRIGAGAGGSSFVSGKEGCSAIKQESTNNSNIHFSGNIHYSNHSFLFPIMLGGNETMTLPNGTISVGHQGNGHARITNRIFTYLNAAYCKNSHGFFVL